LIGAALAVAIGVVVLVLVRNPGPDFGPLVGEWTNVRRFEEGRVHICISRRWAIMSVGMTRFKMHLKSIERRGNAFTIIALRNGSEKTETHRIVLKDADTIAYLGELRPITLKRLRHWTDFGRFVGWWAAKSGGPDGPLTLTIRRRELVRVSGGRQERFRLRDIVGYGRFIRAETRPEGTQALAVFVFEYIDPQRIAYLLPHKRVILSRVK
jgi:hypothetical protein